MSNVFSFVGACGRDAEVRYLPSGQAVLNVNVANNVGFGDKQQTLWIRVALFGKRAEGNLQNYLKKGQQVFVSGELSVNEYRANDGSMKYSLELMANSIELVGKKSEGGTAPMPPASNNTNSFPPSNSQNNNNMGGMSGGYDDAPYDDDIPF